MTDLRSGARARRRAKAERQDDAIVLPASFWWAVVVCTLTVGGIIVGVAHSAGWLR